ncbi:MAG: hypothetical protein ACU85E_03460 [Gammaproteobacteria bacterium]
MSKNNPLILISIVTMNALLLGCTTPEPTRGDFMISQGASMVDVGVKWNEGNKLLEIGNGMIAEGRENVNEGNRLIEKGNKQISEGKNLVEHGKKLIAESETIYRQRTAREAEAPDQQQPEETIEVFPLAE